MTTPRFLQQINTSSGLTGKPTLYRSKLIDPGCKGLFDFGRQWGYPAQVSPIPSGSTLRAYRRSGTNTTVSGTPNWSGGMMQLTSLSQIALLPVAQWEMPSTNTNFAFGWIGKVPLSGYPISGTGTGSAFFPIGWCQTNGSNRQYGFQVSYDKATGIATNAFAGANAQLVSVFSAIPSDGLPHLFGVEFRVITSTTFQILFYVDGPNPVVTSGMLTYSGSLVVPGSGVPALGTYYSGSTGVAGALGRAWLWDLTVSGSKTMSDLMTADSSRVSRFS